MLARLSVAALIAVLMGAPALAAELPPVEPAVRTGARSGDAAIIIGNEAYAALPQATYAVADARAMKDYLSQTVGVRSSRTKYLENVTRSRMLSETKRMVWKARRNSTLWIYFSGHGQVASDGSERTLLGVDASLGDLDAKGVKLTELVELLKRNRRPQRIVVILDAGFGNNSRDGLELIPGHEVEIPKTWETGDPRVVVWAPADDDGPAHAWKAVQHGMFTWAALGALRGWADGEVDGEADGKVTLEEAQAYTRRIPRALGRTANPPEPSRDKATWALASGKHLEAGPTDEVLEQISQEDRERTFSELTTRLRAEASMFWQDTLAQAQAGGESGRLALESYIDEYEQTEVNFSWVIRIPEVHEARRVLANYDEQGGIQGAAAAVAAAEVAEVEPCDDLQLLEGPAMLGQLSPGQTKCLDGRITTERVQTDKDKISRLMLVNAEASGNTAEWERLVARHLQDIDRSDPDLCMRYAIFLSRSGLEAQEEAIRWADVSLENKQRWEGDDYVKRVYGLYRLRAEAANKLWLDAEKQYRKDSSIENEDDTSFYRGMTKDYAREWLDYARASGKSSEKAFNLCASSAGTTDFCKSGL